MDRNQVLNDPETAQRYALQGLQAQMWTAMPAIVSSVNLEAMTCEVQPAIKGVATDENGVQSFVNMPPLLDCPIVFPSAGGFTITFPIAVDDEVLVVISSRCIDSWWQSGGVQIPMELRMHDLSDGFVIPGPKSQPNVISNVSATDVQIRNDDGDTYVSITGDGKIGVTNATTDLNTVLTNLQSALNTFMTALAGFSGGGTPVTQAMLQAPAAACESSLATVLTEIGELLE
jgi:hypothetical protein